MQMLAVFDRHQMPAQSRALCVKLARKHESDGRILPALAWAVQGNVRLSCTGFLNYFRMMHLHVEWSKHVY
jgi:hypothetical protein